MANYQATTVSEGGEVNDQEAVKKIIAEWQMGEINVTCEDNILNIYGYDDFQIYSKDDEDYNDATEEALKKLCPYIVTPLIISSAGAEKCRYVGAGAWIVTQTEVLYASLYDAIKSKLNNHATP